MMNMYKLPVITLACLLLSGCMATHQPEEVPVRITYSDVTLTNVRGVYKDSNVEIYDLNQYPSSYAAQRQYAKPPMQYALNSKIPVKDRSVEIYDLSYATASSGAPVNTLTQETQQLPLVPPSGAKDDYASPFYVIEEEGSLTDPLAGENSQTSVIVPPSSSAQEDDIELMTAF
ncbi:MAG: hypothetical protein ACPG05_00110 [Bdellovibrionales bacterium]